MKGRRKYVKRPDSFVTAVQLDLDTEGFTYEKWGGTQACKPGDWLVNNGGDVYTVDQATFAETYRTESPGVYVKIVPVWAEVAAQAGVIETRRGARRMRWAITSCSTRPTPKRDGRSRPRSSRACNEQA